MIGDYEEIHTIKELLHASPQGLSITDISKQLHLHRTTAAKYLDMLQMKGMSIFESWERPRCIIQQSDCLHP
jgi:response regulator of citrate/malate metabolism